MVSTAFTSLSAREESGGLGLAAALALAALSGAACWAAAPPIGFSWLAFVGWAPLLIAVHRQPLRRAVGLGVLHGLVCNLLGFHWLTGVIQSFARLPGAVCVLLMALVCAYNAGRSAAIVWLSARAARRGWPPGLAFLLAFSAGEGLYPMLFPWYSAVQVHRSPVWMQLAEIGGPVLVGAGLAASSIAVAELAWARIDGRRICAHRLAFALAFPPLMAAYGAWRMSAMERRIAEAPKALVGLVQANIDQAGSRHRDAIALHRRASAELETTSRPDLIVWPETALGAVSFEAGLRAAAQDARGAGQPAFTAPLLAGALLGRGRELTNSAILFGSESRVLGVYDKVHPLAFGEYVPLGDTFPKLYEWLPNAGTIRAGREPRSLRLGDHRITVLICYEDILPSYAKVAVDKGAPDLLVNLTNDAWFGDSVVPEIHLALAKFRAIEHRRFFVRAANSGVSAFVDPLGRASGETPVLEAATRLGEVRWMTGKTPFELLGEAPCWLSFAAVLGMGLVSRRRAQGIEPGRLGLPWPSPSGALPARHRGAGAP